MGSKQSSVPTNSGPCRDNDFLLHVFNGGRPFFSFLKSGLPAIALLVPFLFAVNGALGQQTNGGFSKYPYIDDGVATERGIYLAYNDQFQKAFSLVDSMMNREPSSIQWKYFHVMVLWRELIVKGWGTGKFDSSLSNRIGAELIALKKATDSTTNKSSGDIKALFYAGAVYGYLGIYYAGVKDQMFKAISVGKDGLDFHKKALLLDSTCYDAYYSLGVYNFYASRVPWYLKPFLFVFGMSGSEEKAEKYLRLTTDKGVLAKYAAAEMLAQLYDREKRYDSSAAIYRRLAEEFPNASYRYCIRFWVECDVAGRDSEAVGLMKEEVRRSRTCAPNEYDARYLANIYLNLGNGALQAGKYDDAIGLFKEALKRKLGYPDWLLYSLGQAYEKAGHIHLAIETYRSVQKEGVTNKVYEDVQKRLARLLSK